MKAQYETYCLADPLFYDAPGVAAQECYPCAEREAPAGWLREAQGDWVNYAPDGVGLLAQGWKVHVSGRLDNAERIIEAVWAYCGPREVSFKFLHGPVVVLSRNSKYAGRGGSGKLVTIYPRDEAELELICKDLDELLRGEPGPYILSDLRWAQGPVHVRYGGFTPRYCKDERGSYVLAIESPSGALVPDDRGPVFRVPPWVTVPDFLQPHMDARSAVTVTDIPYEIEEALHFSNGGGVYRGTDKRSGATVVLKEARPHAGLSGDGADAIARLRRERDVLERLTGIEAVPELLDYFTLGEHEFLVMEHVDGEVLFKVIVRRSPWLDNTADAGDFAEYAEWALGVYEHVERAISKIHGRGVVYGDLHTNNIIERPAGGISLIDFEVAQDMGAAHRPGLGAAGFVAPRDTTGADIDRYTLACLRLALFTPAQALISLDRSKSEDLAEVITSHFPVQRSWLNRAVEVITGTGQSERPARKRWRIEPTPASWQEVRASVTKAILASASPGRDDRLFPGDIAQFRPGGGLDIAHGAAGVLYALDVTGAGRYPDHEEWLIQHALDPRDGTPPGLYDGMHGVAYALAHLGHLEPAAKVLDMCLNEDWERGSDDLRSGLAGLVLNFAHMADVLGEPGLNDAAARGIELLADRLGTVDDVAETSGGDQPYAGLLRGSAGRALAFIGMYERDGDPALLDLAAVALRQDLRRCVRREEDGQLHVDEGWRTVGYLAHGSVGIGLVLRRFLVHREDEQFAEALPAIREAACGRYFAQSGLFAGRAGMVLYLSGLDDARRDEDLAAQVRGLAWHALSFEGELAFPGEQLLRLSMDLATGSTGVLLALGAALHDRPVHLPFLGPQDRRLT